jgi:hypothetical protein
MGRRRIAGRPDIAHDLPLHDWIANLETCRVGVQVGVVENELPFRIELIERRPAKLAGEELRDRAVGSDRFEVRDAQNYFGPPVAAGTYKGGNISVPMTNLAVAAPVGEVPTPPKPTLPEFGTFVIVKVEQKSGT